MHFFILFNLSFYLFILLQFTSNWFQMIYIYELVSPLRQRTLWEKREEKVINKFIFNFFFKGSGYIG